MGILGSDYTVETDNIDKDAWSHVLLGFNDANIYQTWSYGAVRWGEKNLSHLLLKKKEEIVAAAQARIIKPALLPAGIAYVRWGGMWQRKGGSGDPDVFRHLILALRQEYAQKRGLFLRILPNIMDKDAQEIIDVLQEEGFERRTPLEGGRTLYIDLRRNSLEELQASLRRTWRKQLKKAENSNLELINASNDELFDIFITTYREMHSRKGFTEYVNIDEFRLMQQDLDDALKMKILACQSKGEVYAALIFSALGDMGLALLGATSDKGLNSGGLHYVMWKSIEWLKTRGYRWYDLGGYNPARVPGTAHFKSGLAGKKGIDSKPIGQFDICTSKLSYFIVRQVDGLRVQYRRLRERVNRFKKEAVLQAAVKKILPRHS
jgi:lipid II:glycine glycyltransferase (peptidoglycan interpeptide bridge formation enzyme)